jgi:predicted nuclease with RNAse H fold
MSEQPRKGFHCAAIDGDALVVLERLATPNEVAARLAELEPTLTAIDSPIGAALDGDRSRIGERELARADLCNIRFTPDRLGLASNPKYYEWIEHGFELYAACRQKQLAVIECFPTASGTVWAGKRGAARRSQWTREALHRQALSGLPVRMNQDDRDAIAAALTARAHCQHQTVSFGDIVVPKR